ncbi:ATP-binding protein [Duganella violaceipulchra]|uniref:ATP-binding protein n=1 Tax=Duganella violaceipulchra TaxID=2849652 RepID=A0AA41HJI8_9BURK|nr:ATP-binding protein [Duganella violaceicalia]MBV6325684.1 ATP-binding protein [Duganella violaceicalia]MCP2012813.1 hypothetical protein [Duganella violaceicalia]
MKKKASVSEKPDVEPDRSDDACEPPSVDGRSANELLSLTKHPLFGKTLVLPTEPIKEMVGAMRRAVILRELGCCFTATSGYGKSRGLIMAEHELRKIFPNVPIFRHIVDNQQVPSIRAFFKNFLLTVGITDIAGETFDLRVRLGAALEEAGLGGSEKMVVLLIDEAQGMALQDFCFLKDIGNQLERVDVHFVVFMMGQEPEFTRVAQRLRARRYTQVLSVERLAEKAVYIQ